MHSSAHKRTCPPSRPCNSAPTLPGQHCSLKPQRCLRAGHNAQGMRPSQACQTWTSLKWHLGSIRCQSKAIVQSMTYRCATSCSSLTCELHDAKVSFCVQSRKTVPAAVHERYSADSMHVTGVRMSGLLGVVASRRCATPQVMMAVIRLQASNGDIVLTLSTPRAGTATMALPVPDSAASEDTPDEQAQLFEAVCKTLRFEDRSLLS